MTIRQLDPERVAALSDADYAAFVDCMTLMRAGAKEIDIPAALYVRSYRSANACGSRVRCHGDLIRVAVQFEARRLAIERFRQVG